MTQQEDTQTHSHIQITSHRDIALHNTAQTHRQSHLYRFTHRLDYNHRDAQIRPGYTTNKTCRELQVQSRLWNSAIVDIRAQNSINIPAILCSYCEKVHREGSMSNTVLGAKIVDPKKVRIKTQTSEPLLLTGSNWRGGQSK